MARKLGTIRLTLKAQTGEDDKLYGSITSRDVEEALHESGFEIDRRKIVMEPIRALGDHKVIGEDRGRHRRPDRCGGVGAELIHLDVLSRAPREVFSGIRGVSSFWGPVKNSWLSCTSVCGKPGGLVR